MAIIIKDNIVGKKVYGKNWVFGCDSDEERIVIPNHVEGIMEQAFAFDPPNNSNANQKVVEFESGGSIIVGPAAFASTFIKEIDFSDSVIEILDGAFGWCSHLETVKFRGNLIKIGPKAFHDADRIEELDLPDGLQMIGTQAFQGCKSL